MNLFSQNLRFLIRRFDISQEQIATYIGKKQTTISNWVNGNSFPDARDLVKIYEFFGFSLDSMILEDMESKRMVTDEHVEEFRQGSGRVRKFREKIQVASKGYFSESGITSIVMDDGGGGKAVLKLLKGIDRKVDEVKGMIEAEKKRGKK